MTNATNRPTGESSSQEGFPMERELIVVAKSEAQLRVTRARITSVEGVNVNSLADILASQSAVMRPLFGINEEQIQARIASVAAETDADVPDLSLYYRVEAPDEHLEELATRLREHEVVEAAYVKPAAELPIALDQVSEIFHHMVPLAEEAPSVSPDFTVRQAYLDAAPGGIDARYAWTQSGSGAGVGIIDIEGAWRFTHEDLTQNQGGVVGGTQSTNLKWRNHGTAVVGEFGSDRNTFGCTGICPDANVRAISIFGGLGSARAIRLAADMLNSGDIILIELHRGGPRSTGIRQQGLIAIEWWPDDFDAIRYATSRGVIVVEAAGNGAENLDDPIYNTPSQGFPSNWTNPFNRTNRDSGAIVVGAGAPPPNTHGRDHGPDRSRLDFSNYGSLIDAQGWGREVTTCGYGDLQGGSDEDLWYTDQFSGTSSASPIVVGALACLQSILRTRGKSPVSPAAARILLRSTGSPQQDAPGRPRNQRIGNRPNIREMLALAELIGSTIQIKSKHSGKFLNLDVSKGPHTINGTNVHQWDWHDGNSQKWILTVQGDGSYQITSKHSGKCLDLDVSKGSQTINGTNVQQWDWHGGNNQKWILTVQGDGSYQITSKHSGKCLDLYAPKIPPSVNGTNVQQWDWHGGNNQKWILTVQDDGSYQITSKHSGKCLDLYAPKGSHTINGTNVQQWDWYGTNNQKWILTFQDDGTYQIKSKRSGKCLDLDVSKGSQTINGTNVQQWDWHGGNNQKWILTLQDDSSYQITSKHSGKCLDLDVSKRLHTINGTNVQQWDWYGTNNQKWILIPST